GRRSDRYPQPEVSTAITAHISGANTPRSLATVVRPSVDNAHANPRNDKLGIWRSPGRISVLPVLIYPQGPRCNRTLRLRVLSSFLYVYQYFHYFLRCNLPRDISSCPLQTFRAAASHQWHSRLMDTPRTNKSDGSP